LVAGCEDNSVSLYDLERGEKINTYYSKRYGVDLVRFTHHNKTILCASKRDNNCKETQSY
jgi:COMPASS component SWD2